MSLFPTSFEVAESDAAEAPTPAEPAELPAGATNGDAAMEEAAAPIAADPAPRQCMWEHGVLGYRGYWRCDEPALPGKPWCSARLLRWRAGQTRRRSRLALGGGAGAETAIRFSTNR